MKWVDAAERVLTDAGTSMHYSELADAIIRDELVQTNTKTPAITLHASINLDIRRRRERGLPPRFIILRGGEITLSAWEGGPLEDALRTVEASRAKASRGLVRKLRALSGSEFESFLEVLFSTMGYDVTVTGGSQDEGIDLVATFDAGIGIQRVGIQAKCLGYRRRVGPNTVRLLRDALTSQACNAGAIVTTSRFNAEARDVAQESGRLPIQLVDADEVADLAIEYQVGIRTEPLEMFAEDLDLVFEAPDEESR